MYQNPGLDGGRIAACLEAHYGLPDVAITFLPVGLDPYAAVYEAVSGDGTAYFLKIRFGPINESNPRVPRALIDRGIGNILAPLRTRSAELWAPLDGYPGYGLVLYPFIRGEDAMTAGLSDEQWQEFGATLRAVHSSGLGETFRGQLPVETFTLPSAALVRQMLDLAHETDFASAVAAQFAAFWREHAARIRQMLARAEELGEQLQSRTFELVLCHADIHAANILVSPDGRITLIDWDGPLIAPRERDLLFVVGSRIARAVEPREEELFFAGYGPTAIDPAVLIYYRYERIVEDIGEFAKSVFLNPSLGEPARAAEAEMAMSFFAPGGDLDRAETVILPDNSIASS